MDSVVENCSNTKMAHVPYKTLCFSLADEQNGNDLPSPVSARSISSLSNRSVESPPDIEMFECLSDGNSVEGDPSCSFLKSSPSTTGLIITELYNDTHDDHARYCIDGSVDGSSRASSPLLSSARQSVSESSSEPPCRSFSDGSMDRVLRSNSFCLQDSDQALSISYLAESAGSPATPSDLGVPSLRELGVTPKEQMKHLHLGDVPFSPHNQTYFLDECTGQPALSVAAKARGSPLAVPTSKFDFATPGSCRTGHSALKLRHNNTQGSGRLMTAADSTFMVPASEESDPSNVQTSTPVQSLSNKTFCLPTLNESPFTKEPGDQGSSKADGMKEQPGSGPTPTGVATKTATVAPKVKKFTKPDFSAVKSKIFSKQASTQKSSNLPVVQASPFCSSKRNEEQVQKPARPTRNKPSATSALLRPSATPKKIALSRGEAPPSDKQEKPPASHNKLMFPKPRPRLWSDSSSVPKTKADTQHQRGKTAPPSFIAKVYKAVTQSKAVPQRQQLKSIQGHQNGSTSSQEDALSKRAPESRLERTKISPKMVSSKPAGSVTGSAVRPGAGLEEKKGRFGVQSSPCRERAAPGSPAAGGSGSRHPPIMAKLRLGSTRGFSPNKDSQAPGHSKSVLNNVSTGVGSSRPQDAVSGVKSSPKKALPPVTPSRIPTQPQGVIKNISGSSHSSGHNLQGYGESQCNSGGRAASSKASGLRSRLQTPAKSTTRTVYRSAASSNPTAIKPVSSTSKKLPPTRLAQANSIQPVDKNKSRPNARNPQPPPPAAQQQQQVNGHRDPAAAAGKWSVEHYQAQCARSTTTIQELKRLLLGSNCRFEAVTVVLQRCIAEHEESLRKCGELSQELVNLREELVNSSQSCDRLEQEKEDLRAAFDGVLQKLQEQHRNDLAELEERLRTFYAAEWEKVHQVYQEEADKCKTQMEQQLESLKSKHEVLKKDLEASHADKMESIKQQHEQSLEEVRKAHETEMQTLDNALKETEVNLTGQIEELRTENSALNEKLREDEKRREMFADSQKDSHTLYLEQELESLKVVLEIKTQQLHQQDKKLMQMDKVLERNVKLDECLQKVQQENEDLKARMDRHMALSRQLSTEQAVLQESLQKESNVNKRLSMENEELLWKLHNGDLSSPRKLSPTTPSMSLQSPRNSGVFSSPPVSPR
ncbi:microtubule-associated tumor suppressor 1 homolog A isoform X2 [Alosa sapidissima]|uniref:microtubule-associated tumor suppressor 1 homolog A isoform X2 n=1 Tax=Alosa sapidissima TaxID=34773 RepID=UPI001C08DBB8|nr:microtubule-associated tumor suppressor 1 homolog A isoform X2 [Alosa sapidissima]